MIKNYLITSLRTLLKDKMVGFINIFGLSIGIACATLIFLWVEDELTWDSIHAKKDRIYFVRENQQYDSYMATFSSTPGLLGPSIQVEIPGIANTCRTNEGSQSLLFSIGDRSMYASGKYADPSIFSMFTLPFVQGNAKSAFAQQYSMVVTEKMAVKLFGNDINIIGKTVRVDNKQDYVISGVLKDIPENSSLQFEWIAPFDVYFQQRPWLRNWGNNALSTYVELKPGVDVASVNKLLYNFLQKRDPSSIARPFLFSMRYWRLYNVFNNGKQTGGGRIAYVRMFSFIAWIILLVACINFMNLATARSEKRAKEVGVRKVLGAGKKKLVIQFIGEAMFMAMAAAVGALIIMSLALASFNGLVQKNISLQLGNPFHITAFLLVTIICGLIAGSYPSLYLSSFNPVFVLKGVKLKGGSAAFIRKGLVVLQFSISIILIIGTLVIYQQIQHVKNRNLGFSRNNLVEMRMQGDMVKKFSIIKEDLLNTGMIANVALSDHSTITSGNNSSGLTWHGKTPGTKTLVSERNVTPEFINTTGLTILEGRNLQMTDTTFNKKLHVVITQSLAQLMGKGSTLGKELWYEDDSSGVRATVVGVVNNYVYGDMYGTSDPVLFMVTVPANTTLMYVRIKPIMHTEEVLAKMEAILKKHNAAYPFDYRFVDDQFNNMFVNEMLISKLSRVFATLAIFISCLGLLGLTAYTAERRTKEIGVRKVMGANVSDIAALLLKDFIKLVCLAAVISFPIAGWAMHNWLQGYAYRITINGGIFIAAALGVLLIAFVTASFHAVKTALANPVKSLRTDG